MKMVATLFFLLTATFLTTTAVELDSEQQNCSVASLKEATRNGNLDTFKNIIESGGCNVNDIKDEDDNTPIHWASKWGNIDFIKYLVQHKANVNTPGWLGYTTLHVAANSKINNQFNTVKYLVENCTADVNKFSTYGYLPINIAAQSDSLDVVKYLLPKVTVEYRSGNTPVHDAAIMGHLNIIKYLVQQGADVNARDTNDDTPLHWAAFYGHLELVKFMVLNLRANVNAVNSRRQTPRQLAQLNHATSVVTWLQNYNVQ